MTVQFFLSLAILLGGVACSGDSGDAETSTKTASQVETTVGATTNGESKATAVETSTAEKGATPHSEGTDDVAKIPAEKKNHAKAAVETSTAEKGATPHSEGADDAAKMPVEKKNHAKAAVETPKSAALHCFSDQHEEDGVCKETPISRSSCTAAEIMPLVTFKGASIMGHKFAPSVSATPQSLGSKTTEKSGFYESELTLSVEDGGYFFFDFDSASDLPITEEEAYTSNTKWDVAFFYQYGFLTNGGDLPGDLEIAVVKESADQPTDEAGFAAFTLEKAEKILSDDFYHEQIFKTCNAANILKVGDGEQVAQLSFLAPFGSKGASDAEVLGLLPSLYDPVTHAAKANPQHFYILRNSSKNWWYKLRVKEYKVDPLDLGQPITITIQYQRLD